MKKGNMELNRGLKETSLSTREIADFFLKFNNLPSEVCQDDIIDSLNWLEDEATDDPDSYAVTLRNVIIETVENSAKYLDTFKMLFRVFLDGKE